MGSTYGLIAIDVLLEPDGQIHSRAIAYNQRFLRRVPPPRGFELGESRVPHVTIVQRYVHADSLDPALDAVASVAAAAVAADRGAFDLVAAGAPHVAPHVAPHGAFHGDGVATVVWSMAAGQAVLELQSSVLSALEPFVADGGDERAFVRTKDEPEVSESTIRYVERFVPDHSGANYEPHLTLGKAVAEDVAELDVEPSTPIAYTAPALAVYQLGDHGTARRLLARWPVPTSDGRDEP